LDYSILAEARRDIQEALEREMRLPAEFLLGERPRGHSAVSRATLDLEPGPEGWRWQRPETDEERERATARALRAHRLLKQRKR
jgi:hypothetical protein